MNRFWDTIILPIIEQINAHYIVEIGSESGINTKNILSYCEDHDAHMTAIDPAPIFDVEKLKNEYGNKFEFYEGFSLSILPLLTDYDAVLIDGDHNWYTVYNELKIIEKSSKGKKFPLVFLHDVGWPYARRDLYYNPENIPEAYRQPYKQLGMYPGETDLRKKGGLNWSLYNSIYENNPKNGVLTAVEDFVNESNLKFTFKIIYGFHGLGFLFPQNYEIDNIIKKTINKANLSDKLESERIKFYIAHSELHNQINLLEKNLNENKTRLENLQNQFIEMERKLKYSNDTVREKDVLLEDVGNRLVRLEGELESSEDLVNEKDRLIVYLQKREEDLVRELKSKMNNLKSNFLEIEYSNNIHRSISSRLFSKFPSLYIFLKMKETGIRNVFINIKGYNAIKKYNLFDVGYYLRVYPDVRQSGVDPTLHYIYKGFKEGRKPNPTFDGDHYLRKNRDVKDSNLNPLVYYSLYGINELKKL